MIEEGTPAPDFTLASDTGEEVTLSAYRGRPVVLYFYPKDDTLSTLIQRVALGVVPSACRSRLATARR